MPILLNRDIKLCQLLWTTIFSYVFLLLFRIFYRCYALSKLIFSMKFKKKIAYTTGTKFHMKSIGKFNFTIITIRTLFFMLIKYKVFIFFLLRNRCTWHHIEFLRISESVSATTLSLCADVYKIVKMLTFETLIVINFKFSSTFPRIFSQSLMALECLAKFIINLWNEIKKHFLRFDFAVSFTNVKGAILNYYYP